MGYQAKTCVIVPVPKKGIELSSCATFSILLGLRHFLLRYLSGRTGGGYDDRLLPKLNLPSKLSSLKVVCAINTYYR